MIVVNRAAFFCDAEFVPSSMASLREDACQRAPKTTKNRVKIDEKASENRSQIDLGASGAIQSEVDTPKGRPRAPKKCSRGGLEAPKRGQEPPKSAQKPAK